MPYTPYVLPKITLSGSPFEIGKQYGEQARLRILLHLMNQKAAMARLHPEQPEWWRACVREYLPPYQELAFHVVEEMQGLARGADIDFEDVLLLNVRDELIVRERPLFGDNCTSFGCSGSVTLDGHPILGQTKNTAPISKDLYVVIAMRQKGRPDILQMPYAGEFGVFGLSSSGMAVFGNSLYVKGRGQGRLPFSLLRRLVLEADSVDDVLRLLRSQGCGTPGNLTIGDRTGRIIALEITDHGFAVVEARDGILAHANHINSHLARYESYDEPEKSASCLRQERLEQLLNAERGRLTAPLAMRCLADHSNFPRSICRHAFDADSSETTAALVVEPALGLLHAVRGQPCRNWPVTYAL